MPTASSNFPFILISVSFAVKKLFSLMYSHLSIPLFRRNWKHFQNVLAFLFAIEEINKSSHLLPNLSLGYYLYNALPNNQRTIENTLFLLSGMNQTLPNYNCQAQKQSIAIITGCTPIFSAQIGTLLELYKSPQVTYGPFDPSLSDKSQFSSVYQMAAKESFLVHGIIWLLLQFGWTWVALYVSDDIQGEHFLQDLKTEMIKKGICVDFTEKLPATTGTETLLDFNHMTRIRVSSANVYIIYGDRGSVWNLVWANKFDLILGKVWVMQNLRSAHWRDMFFVVDHMPYLFHGSLLLSNQKKKIPGFEHFLKTLNPYQYPQDILLTELWTDVFHCSLAGSLCMKVGDCPPNSSLEFIPFYLDMMTVFDSNNFIYHAVYMVAQVLHKIFVQKIEIRSPEGEDQTMLLPWQQQPKEYNHQADKYLYAVILFSTQTPESLCSHSCSPGFQKIPQEGRPACCFICVSCTERDISNLTDAEHCFQCAAQEYPNDERTHCLPKPVTYLDFKDALGLSMTCTALWFTVVTAVVLGVFVKHRDTPIVKANNQTLSFILLISLLLCFLCSLLFIGHPNTVTCILQQVTFGLVFTVAVSTVLAKTIIVVLAFKVMKPGRTMRYLLLSGASNSVIPICFLIQLIICGIWLGTSPPFVDTDSHSEPRNLIIMCNKGSLIAFYCVLGYLGLLALGSFTLAFLARNLPDTFNEAKFLTFSMLVFCSVWVTFLPVYQSTKGKFMVAVEVFSILSSSAGLLCCIFAPKCYIILIRPDKNCLKGLKNKGGSRRNRHPKVLLHKSV
ncbi:vomeronasal type-2 receptor 116 [Tupaia chinensis]|uniref:vomeronasal type-2 receptor 116 n=1 Tax=Tupaia chinensis TaxID=246437 RepID=UPI000FFC0224|nr:vomeronasal type-2 receptor 116 [Tupaia chinensis]